MAGSKTYVYCNVLPSGYKSPYLYITDFEVKPGDIVIIPLRDSEKAGLVIGICVDVDYKTGFFTVS